MNFINFYNLLVGSKIVGLRLKWSAYESGFIKKLSLFLLIRFVLLDSANAAEK